MIIVSGSITIDPAHQERARTLIRDLVEATRAEPGNISYEFFVALDDPGRFAFYEEWESQEAIDAHSASDHMRAFFAAAGELELGKVELHQHTVTESKKVL